MEKKKCITLQNNVFKPVKKKKNYIVRTVVKNKNSSARPLINCCCCDLLYKCTIIINCIETVLDKYTSGNKKKK